MKRHCNVIIVQEKWPLSKEYLADLKEVFMLFDKDEDGVITFTELEVVMKCLGQRPSGWLVFMFTEDAKDPVLLKNYLKFKLDNFIEEELLAMVREVSQDKLYDTVEFNEFLTMIAMQKKHEVTHEDLVEAFK